MPGCTTSNRANSRSLAKELGCESVLEGRLTGAMLGLVCFRFFLLVISLGRWNWKPLKLTSFPNHCKHKSRRGVNEKQMVMPCREGMVKRKKRSDDRSVGRLRGHENLVGDTRKLIVVEEEHHAVDVNDEGLSLVLEVVQEATRRTVPVNLVCDEHMQCDRCTTRMHRGMSMKEDEAKKQAEGLRHSPAFKKNALTSRWLWNQPLPVTPPLTKEAATKASGCLGSIL